MTPSPQIAYSPLDQSSKVSLVSVLCPASHPMDRPLYLSFLGDRMQAMVDASFNPHQAVQDFQDEMYRTGLVRDLGNIPLHEAGARLVASNPSVWEKLDSLGVFRAIKSQRKAPATDNLAARRSLQADKDSPADSLTRWASLMGAVV